MLCFLVTFSRRETIRIILYATESFAQLSSSMISTAEGEESPSILHRYSQISKYWVHWRMDLLPNYRGRRSLKRNIRNRQPQWSWDIEANRGIMGVTWKRKIEKCGPQSVTHCLPRVRKAMHINSIRGVPYSNGVDVWHEMRTCKKYVFRLSYSQ